MQVKRLLEQEKKSRVGLDFVHQELIGSLWFAINVISCELQLVLFSRQQTHHQRRDVFARGRGIYLD